MNVDNDEVEGADNVLTVFVNCKVKAGDGSILGIVGVGIRIQCTWKSCSGRMKINSMSQQDCWGKTEP